MPVNTKPQNNIRRLIRPSIDAQIPSALIALRLVDSE